MRFWIVEEALINPRLVKDRSIKLQKQILSLSGEERPENLSVFLSKYNQLESIISTSASNIINENKLTIDIRRNALPQSLNILISSGYISKELSDQINQLRMYRNTIVHGQDMKVSQKALDELNSILDQIQKNRVV